jgi:glyoxylase-like metal-dependent hydrolase (beta-lactamase superfamily II)
MRSVALFLLLALVGFSPQNVPAAVSEPKVAPPGWFHIIKMDAATYAISEPKYWQENVSYLILGSSRGVLFDTGPGLYSIRLEVEKLTHVPLLVIPSHLHFDHVGRIQEFSTIGLMDLPELRHQAHDDVLSETTDQYLLTSPYSFKVSRWLRDGEVLDLGGRQLTVINTPGHTPESIALLEPARRRMFTGDLVNRIVTLCDVPGSDVQQTAQSLQRLMQLMPAGSTAYEAHAEKPISWAELSQLGRGARAIADGKLDSKAMCLGGQPMRRFDVGAFAFVLPADPSEPLKPLASATQTLDWLGAACPATNSPKRSSNAN